MRLVPRRKNLEIYASSLLVGLGVGPLVGCSNEVIDPGTGGSGGGGGATSSAMTAQGSTTTAQATTTVGSTTSVGSTSTGMGMPGCQDPMPIIVDGVDTGVDTCSGGQLRRREAVDCPAGIPDPSDCCGGCPDGSVCSGQGEIACSCIPACTTDADCGQGSICLCGNGGGLCTSALCASANDCAPGQECTTWDSSQGCLYFQFACTTPADTCGGDLDCPGVSEYCTVLADGHRECVQGGCAIGRPFLVDDVARTAATCERADWALLTKDLPHAEAEIRARVAQGWERIALMEHASVAAFARFSLQLLALGAGPELVRQTTQAMADETLHAELAFGIASHYRGRAVGPDRLGLDGALGDGSAELETVLALTIREGVVGETVAACEAAELSDIAQGSLAEVLARIAHDETSHARLALAFVDDALSRFGARAHAVVAGEIALIEEELRRFGHAQVEATEQEIQLERYGLVSDARRAELRRETLARAVLPVLRTLLAERARLAA